MLPFRLLLCTATVLVLGFARSLHADETWTEIRTPHLRVVTNGALDQAEQVAMDFERMRSVMGWRFPGMRLDLNAPLTVYAMRDFATLLRLRPSWEDPEFSDFYGNWERNIAFADLSTWSKRKTHPVFTGYVHELLRQNSWPLPVWLDRGYAQLLGVTSFEGKDVTLGAPSERWIQLKSQPLLPVQHVLNDRPLLGFDPAIQSARQQQVNEAWGLVHFLSFAPGMQSGALLLNYYHRLQQGEEPTTAFRAEFGDAAQLDAKFAAYVKARSLGAVVTSIPDVDAAGFSTRVLNPAQVLDEEGIIRIETGNLQQGRGMFERALRADATDAIASEEVGILEYGQGHLAQARQHWQAAVAADATRYVSRFALVMTGTGLRQQTPEQRKQTLLELQQIVKLQPRFTPAYVRIAVLQWWQGSLDAALRACAEAERLTPARGGYHLLHARLLLAQNKPEAAAALLRQQVQSAKAEGQTYDDEYPFVTAQIWSKIPQAARGDASAMPFVTPPGKQVAAGKILTVECSSGSRNALRVTLETDSATNPEKLMLTSGDHLRVGFDDTVWIGGGHDPVCPAGGGQPMFALYMPGSKGYGQLIRMELLDDVPETREP